MLVAIALGSAGVLPLPLQPAVFTLGLATGAFTVSAIGVMMDLAAANGDGREGVRMGLWGGAQAVAFAAGGLASTVSIDLARHWLGTANMAYAVVFVAEGLLFAGAASLAVGSPAPSRPGRTQRSSPRLPELGRGTA
jgi:BCD family chlorophyll transporter-like MFS transporter